MINIIITININNLKMQRQHIVVFESHHYGWLAYQSTLTKVKRLLKDENETYYIFKCNVKKGNFSIKLRYPFCEYYDSLNINTYTGTESFEENDDYVIISKTDECEDNGLILTHKP